MQGKKLRTSQDYSDYKVYKDSDKFGRELDVLTTHLTNAERP